MKDRRLIIDTSVFQLQKFGGITTYLAKQLEFLYEQPIRIVSLGAPRSRLNELGLAPSDSTQVRNWRLYQRLRPIIVWPFSNSIYFLPFDRPVLRMPFSQKARIVYVIHDCIPEYFGKRLVRIFYKLCRRLASKNSDHFIFVSLASLQKFRHLYPLTKPASVIHHGIFNRERPRDHPARTRSLLYVGARRGYKNFRILYPIIAAWASSDIKVLCVGGEEESREETQFCNNGTIRFIRNASSQDLSQLYRTTSAVVLTSLDEGFGLVGFEAIANDAPLICIDISIFREVYGECANYFSTEAELETLLNSALEQILPLPVPAKKNQLLSAFTWEKSTKEHFKLLCPKC